MSLVSVPYGPYATIPGEPGGIRAAAGAYSAAADRLRTNANGILRDAAFSTEGAWTGLTSEQFRASVLSAQGYASDAAGAFTEVAGALRSYATQLEDAQRRWKQAVSDFTAASGAASRLNSSYDSLDVTGPQGRLIREEMRTQASGLQSQISGAMSAMSQAYEDASRAADTCGKTLSGIRMFAPSVRATIGAAMLGNTGWDPMQSLERGDPSEWWQMMYGPACFTGAGSYLGAGSFIIGPDGRRYPLVVPRLMEDGKYYNANIYGVDPGEDILTLGGADEGWTTLATRQGTTRLMEPPSGWEKFFIFFAGMNPNLQPQIQPLDEGGYAMLQIGPTGVPTLMGPGKEPDPESPPQAPEFHVESPAIVMVDGEPTLVDRNAPETWNREIRRSGLTPNTRLQTANRAASAVDLANQIGDGISLANMSDDFGVAAYQVDFQVNEDGRTRAMLRTYQIGQDQDGTYIVAPNHVMVGEDGEPTYDNIGFLSGDTPTLSPAPPDDIKVRTIQVQDEEYDR